MKTLTTILAFGAIAVAVAACDPASTSVDTQVEAQQAQSMRGLLSAVGQPRVTNWTEARLMNQIIELRDQPNLQTYTYRSDMDGGLHCLGRSIGYGLPYSAQRSNPEREAYRGSYGVSNLPQAEPNGLFMPDASDATWVIMVNPETGRPVPIYVEDDVTVSPFPLQNVVEQCR